MKLQHIVTLNNGEQEIYRFDNKRESDKALDNAFNLNKTFNTISNILIQPINHPEKWEQITFENGRILEWTNYNSQAREEFNKKYNRHHISDERAIDMMQIN